ncbi:MAG: hypothetical protein ACI81R_001580 [Bradymonadia bacterium]|jgi:uncharacterized protein (DUF58 family)
MTDGALKPKVLEAIGATKLRARSVVEGILGGMHRSPHKGSSVEFAEYKEYAPGDDVRHIDWRAYGRKDRYYIKQFEDETNVRAFLLVDSSGSMDFAFEDHPTKMQAASTLAASLAWLLLRQGDAPGLMLFDERPGFWLPPSTKRAQLDDICTVLDGVKAEGRTSVNAAVSRVAEQVHARSVVFVISDFLDTSDDMLTLARVLRRKRMEVVLFHVMDRAELDLPFEGLTVFEGLESDGELLVDPDDIRAAYQAEMEAHLARITEVCRSADIEQYRVMTDEPLDAPIRAFIQKRARG